MYSATNCLKLLFRGVPSTVWFSLPFSSKLEGEVEVSFIMIFSDLARTGCTPGGTNTIFTGITYTPYKYNLYVIQIYPILQTVFCKGLIGIFSRRIFRDCNLQSKFHRRRDSLDGLLDSHWGQRPIFSPLRWCGNKWVHTFNGLYFFVVNDAANGWWCEPDKSNQVRVDDWKIRDRQVHLF